MNREERIAENDILFRQVNERIRELERDRWRAEEIDFMCECGDASCTRVIRLNVGEYERLRSDPTLFAVLPGHQIEDVEDVVETHPNYLVVKKHPETLERVADADPRS